MGILTLCTISVTILLSDRLLFLVQRDCVYHVITATGAGAVRHVFCNLHVHGVRGAKRRPYDWSSIQCRGE